jgi:two-component system NtrC family sensor kinase
MLDRSQVEAVSMSEVLTVALDAAAEGGVTIRREFASLPVLFGHRGRLIRAISNLLANAAEATDEGSVITVSARATARAIRFAVADDGPGVPADIRGRIFEPFFSTRGDRDASGLGLPMALEIIRAHGGGLRLRDGDGGGAIAEAWLPRATGLVADRGRGRGVRAARRPRVLICDEGVHVASSMARFLSGEHEVLFAADGDEVIAHLAGDDPVDAVLYDLSLPGMDGPALLARVTAPDRRRRILFLAGSALTPDQIALVEAPDSPVLRRPLRPERLLRALDRITAL